MTHKVNNKKYNIEGDRTMKYYISQWADGFQWKLVASLIGTIITGLEGFYGHLLWGFLALFFIDLFTGLLKSWINKIPISSKRLRESVVKLLGYMSLLTAITILGYYNKDAVPLITYIYYFFMFTEFKSILENVREMGVKVPESVTSYINEKISLKKKNKKDEDDEK